MEKVTLFARDDAADPAAALGGLGPEVTELFTTYAGLLAGQGETAVAAKYCGQQDDAASLLLDRLRRSSGLRSAAAVASGSRQVAVQLKAAALMSEPSPKVCASAVGSAMVAARITRACDRAGPGHRWSLA